MKLVVLALAFPLLLAFPAVSAFELGGFQIMDGSKIEGEYLIAGFEGVISCFSQGRHVMDIIYENDSIEISIKFFDTLLERNPLLREEIKKAIMPITIKGSALTLEYDGCLIELHNTPARFLEVRADKIILSKLKYDINATDAHMIKLEGRNFSAILISNNPLSIDRNITAYGCIMLFSYSLIGGEDEKKIEDAFRNKYIGGEITIVGYDEKNETDCISYFGNISIQPIELREGKIVLKIRGENVSGGKVVKVNLGKKICLSDKIEVRFDGKEINKASSFEDVLNPNDDKIYPEYYQLQSEEGVFILISIPHFSEYEVSIAFIVENLVGNAMAISFGMLVILLAAFYMFKK